MVTAAVIATQLNTAGAHPFCLFIDSLDVIKQPGNPGTLYGTPVDSVVITEQLGQPAQMEFLIDDPQKALTIRKNADVYFCDHLGRKDDSNNWITEDLFRGFITSVQKEFDGGIGFRWRVVAISLEAILDRKVLTSGVLLNGMKVNAAMQQIAGQLDPRISALIWEPAALFVGRDGSAVVPNLIGSTIRQITTDIPLAGKTARQALDAISAANDAASVYATDFEQSDLVDIDMQGRLRWNVSNAVTPYSAVFEGLSSTTLSPYSTRAVPADIEYDEDSSQLVTAVYVRGVDTASSGWLTDDDGIANYGRSEAFLDAPECTNSTTRDNIGATYLAQHRIQTRLAFTLSSDHDDLTDPWVTPAKSYGGWHVRNQTSLRSDTGLFTNVNAIVSGITKTFSGGGEHTTLRLSYVGASKSGPTAISSRFASAAEKARTARNLTGTLNEVAIRSKAGVPTDADFDVPRDGYLVLDTTNDTIWIRTNGVWQPSQGYQYDYVEFTANVAITSLVEASADVVVTGTTLTYDGVTPVNIEFFAPDMRPDTTAANRNIWALLFEDGTSIGIMATNYTAAAGSDRKSAYAIRKRTPTAGSHTYSIRAIVSAITGNVGAGTGVAGNLMPGFIRITRA